jgi:hypothetical protein
VPGYRYKFGRTVKTSRLSEFRDEFRETVSRFEPVKQTIMAKNPNLAMKGRSYNISIKELTAGSDERVNEIVIFGFLVAVEICC